MSRDPVAPAGVATAGGLLMALVVFGSSGCVSPPSRDGTFGTQRSAADSNAASYWASFEQNCSLSGLQLVKLKLDSGYAMICSRNRNHCVKWVTTQMARSQSSMGARRVKAEVDAACRHIQSG